MTNEYVNVERSNANPHRVVAIVADEAAVMVVAIGSDGVYRSHVVHNAAPRIAQHSGKQPNESHVLPGQAMATDDWRH